MFLLYNLLLIILSPAILVYYVWRVVISGKSRGAWRQQLGIQGPGASSQGPGTRDQETTSARRKSSHLLPVTCDLLPVRKRIWLHAVSVGETVASAPVIAEIRRLLPDAEIIVSTTTKTGQAMAKKSLPEADQIMYFPLDILPAVWRSLRTVRPDVFVSMESEIWPNFLWMARQMGIPALVANGIVSDNTLKWGRRLQPIYRWSLGNVSKFMMQTEADAERIIELGAPRERVEVVGNCKFDQEMDALEPEQVEEVRQRFGITNGSRVFVAGSTNPGEDEPVIDAFVAARKAHPDLRMVLAPRQVERAEPISEMIISRGLSCGRRSDPETVTGKEDVVILDTFGELASVYGIGDVAFVGGSLIPKGGHNILQPIAHGKPVFFGPFMFKSRDLASQARTAGVGFEIADSLELADGLSDFLADGQKLEDIRFRARAMIASNRGASRRCAEAVAKVLKTR